MRMYLNIVFAVVGWFAIIAQFFLMLDNRTASATETIIRFFSFFTILTNILVSAYFTCLIFDFQKKLRLIRLPGTLTAVTVYITVVGLVYQIALRHIWKPTGLQMLVDELLHTLIPIAVIAYWVRYEQKSDLQWKLIPVYLIYPAVYLAYILLRGSFSGFYPYPFIDIMELGWQPVLINIAALFGFFLLLIFVYIRIGKLFLS